VSRARYIRKEWIKMTRAFAFLLSLSLLGTASAEPSVQTDPKNLVEFEVPDGWAVRDTENGIRFSRSASPGERTILSVLARPRDPARTLEAARATGLSQIKSQEAQLLTDKVQVVNGWDAWESAFDTSRSTPGVIMHSFRMFSKGCDVDVKLMAAKTDYPKYKADLLALVQSIRERKK
jgi:hypothetical protein